MKAIMKTMCSAQGSISSAGYRLAPAPTSTALFEREGGPHAPIRNLLAHWIISTSSGSTEE